MEMPVNQIIQGDCVQILDSLPNESVDLVITSPPYDNLRTYNGYSFDFENLAKHLFRVLKVGGVIVWIVNDSTIGGSETGTSFKQALFFKELGLNLHDTMIWEKPTFTAVGALRSRYAQVFEYMFILSKGTPKTFNPIKDRPNKYHGDTVHGNIRQKDGGTRRKSGDGQKRIAEYGQRFNVWRAPAAQSPKERLGHPAPFPEQLVRDHIVSWSNEGDIILDPMCGSGTTCKASRDLGRRFIGIDVSKQYCEMAKNRLSNLLLAPLQPTN